MTDSGKPAGTSSPGLILGWITLLAFVHGLLWMAVVPPWQAPDEPKHFEFVRLLAQRGDMVAFTNEAESADPKLQRDILASMEEHGFWWLGRAPAYDREAPPDAFADVWVHGSHTALARSSPLYYRALAILQPGGLLAGLYVARLVSVILGALIVFLTGWAARELFPDDPFVRYGAPAFVALLPMFAFLHAGVNNDALVNFLAALAFVLMARLLARGGSLARLILLAAVIAAAIAVKRIAVVLVPTALMAVVLWRATRSRQPRWAVIAWSSLAVALVLGAAAWFLGGGWASLPDSARWNLTQYFFNEPDQPERIAAYLRAPGVARVIADYAWGIHNTFWGSFGWQLITLPTWMYGGLALVALLAIVGAARRVADPGTAASQRAAVLTYAAAIVITGAAAVAFFVAYLDMAFPVPPQGRYLFVAILPIAVILTVGLSAWVPARLRVRALLIFVAALAAFDALALLGFVVPFFYG